MKINIGHWQYPKEFNPDEWVGFIYEILDLDTGRAYIGKKFFHSTTRKKVKNCVNRKKVVKESKWKIYTGSSKELNEQISQRGKDRFVFNILSLHESKSSLAYREVELLVTKNTMRDLMPNGVKKYYNGMIPPIKFKIADESDRELAYRIK